MTWGKAIVGCIVSLGVGVVIGYFLFMHDTPGPVIKPKGPVKETVIERPSNCGEYQKCFYSPFYINGAFISDDTLRIEAGNECKKAQRDFSVKLPITPKKWTVFVEPMILAGYLADYNRIDVLAGGEIGFTRNFGRFSAGAGIIYQQSLLWKSYYAGASVKLGFSF